VIFKCMASTHAPTHPSIHTPKPPTTHSHTHHTYINTHTYTLTQTHTHRKAEWRVILKCMASMSSRDGSNGSAARAAPLIPKRRHRHPRSTMRVSRAARANSSPSVGHAAAECTQDKQNADINDMQFAGFRQLGACMCVCVCVARSTGKQLAQRWPCGS